jgi:hypothetical protein
VVLVVCCAGLTRCMEGSRRLRLAGAPSIQMVLARGIVPPLGGFCPCMAHLPHGIWDSDGVMAKDSPGRRNEHATYLAQASAVGGRGPGFVRTGAGSSLKQAQPADVQVHDAIYC